MSDKPKEYRSELNTVGDWMTSGIWNDDMFARMIDDDLLGDASRLLNKKEPLSEDHGEGEG